MIRVADYIAQTLAAHGIRHVFLVTGGGAMHLNDAFGRCHEMEYVACHHEQACAMAAESYYRLSGRMAAVNVTSGPGGTNALTGVYGAFVDSLAMIVISGQVRYDTTVRSTGLPLRQLGDQELDITLLAAPITKYAVMVTDPTTIRYHMEKALHLALSGRPGPVWLDIPMDVQGAKVDPVTLKGYDPTDDGNEIPDPRLLQDAAQQVLTRLRHANRPVILVGTGVRIAQAQQLLLRVADRLGIPVTTAWNAHDLVPDTHPCYAGRPNSIGDRAGNFAVQNADFLLVLGCRLNIRQIGYNWQTWARGAFKVVVEIDPVELQKPTLVIDLPIQGDVRSFLEAMLALEPEGPTQAHKDYLAWCQIRRERYPVVKPEYWNTSHAVNPYCFVQALFDQLPEGQAVVTGDGTACVTTFQAARIRSGQRLYTNSGCASMGYDLPAAIGACLASNRQRVVCIAGDGSIQMNLQELQTLVTHRLPIPIFLLNNHGYHSIRQTQQNYFPDNPVGCGTESGLGFPNFEKLALAYGLTYFRINTHTEMAEVIRRALSETGPVLCEIMLDLEQSFAPKLASRRLPDGRMVSSPLEDLYPFLSREELAENMLIPMLEE
jgi:acetolactate synthase-1/2/3 large subunit